MPRRYASYSPELAERLCALAAEGHTLESAADEPGMPTRNTLCRWLATRPELRARHREAQARRTGVFKRRWPRKGGQRERMPLYSPELAETICDAVADGLAVREVLARPGMPPTATMYLWLDRHPEFGRMFAFACHVREQALADECLTIADTCLDGPDPAGDEAGGADRPPLTVGMRIELARLRIEARKQRLGHLTPKRYRWAWG